MIKRMVSRHYSLISLILALEMLILLPILALQYYSYKLSTEIVAEELTASASANVSYLRESFSDKITSIIEQQEYLLTSSYTNVPSYLTYARNLSRGNQYVQEVRILNYVKNICYGNSLLHSFSLYYPTLDRQFTVEHNDSLNDLNSVVSPISDPEKIVRQFNERKHILSCEDGELFLIYGKHIGSGSPQYITKAVLDNKAIGNLLSAYGVYPSQTAYLIDWDNQFVISSDSRDTLGSELAQWFVPQHSNDVYSMAFSNGGHSFTIFCADVPMLNATFVHLIDNEVLNAIPSRLRMLIILAVGLTFAVSLLYFFTMRFMVSRPVHELIACFNAVGQGDLEKRMKGSLVREFFILSSGYNAMADRVKELIDKNYRQALLLQQAEFRQLCSQIEPHFLYNSFFMLRHAISSEEIESAEKICGYLGEYFRFITHMSVSYLPLREEYSNVMNYVAIQQIRFSSRLKIDISPLPEELEGCIVPILILQPLIENVIEHGVPAQAGLMSLSFQEEGEDFLICVEDDGKTLSDAQLAELNSRIHADGDPQGTHALGNIHLRLQLFYGATYGLLLSRSWLGGLCVTMRLQKRHDVPSQNHSEEAEKHVP